MNGGFRSHGGQDHSSFPLPLHVEDIVSRRDRMIGRTQKDTEADVQRQIVIDAVLYVGEHVMPACTELVQIEVNSSWCR